MTEVILHVYDVTNSGNEKTNNTIMQINKIFKDGIGFGGIFHSAVQVYGDEEWSFGFCEQGTGVFSCPPTKNPMYTYRETIKLGKTSFSNSKVNQILRELSREWPGHSYDLLSKNCNHFCDALCERLGVPKLPGWVNRFACLNSFIGTTPGGKADVARADKKGGLRGRKALNDISNSRKPSVNDISIEKDPGGFKATGKGKVGGRKALSDVTNSVKLPTKQVPSTGRKLNAVTEEKVPSCIMEENFMHNHQKCIEAQTKAMDVGYFMELVGLSNDIGLHPSARSALPPSSKKGTKHLKMKEIPELEDDFPCYRSLACLSPRSPKAPYMSWGDDDFSDLRLIDSP